MKRLDRAGTAALTLTGVVLATAVGVAVTASARSAQTASTGTAAEKTIQLVSPRPSSTPSPLLSEDALGRAPSSSTFEDGNAPGTTTVTRPPSGSQRTRAEGAAPVRPTAPSSTSVSTTVPDGPSGRGTAPRGSGDTRGDGTPEDDDDDDDDRNGHRGGDDDDSEKDNSGPGNYENPGRSNSGGDD
jgi:hypothetical protein